MNPYGMFHNTSGNIGGGGRDHHLSDTGYPVPGAGYLLGCRLF